MGKGKPDAMPVLDWNSKTERKVRISRLCLDTPPPCPNQTPHPSQHPIRQWAIPIPVFQSFVLIWALQGGKMSLIGKKTFSWVLPAGLDLLGCHSLILGDWPAVD